MCNSYIQCGQTEGVWEITYYFWFTFGFNEIATRNTIINFCHKLRVNPSCVFICLFVKIQEKISFLQFFSILWNLKIGKYTIFYTLCTKIFDNRNCEILWWGKNGRNRNIIYKIGNYKYKIKEIFFSFQVFFKFNW